MIQKLEVTTCSYKQAYLCIKANLHDHAITMSISCSLSQQLCQAIGSGMEDEKEYQSKYWKAKVR